MKHIKKFNSVEQCKDYTNINSIHPAVYKISNNNFKYVYKAGNYIQDGLVFQLDGKYKGPSENICTDIISGNYIINSSTGTLNYKYKDDCLEILNVNDCTPTITFDKSFSSSDDYTVELCFELSQVNSKMFLFNIGVNHSPAFVINNSSICFLQRSNQYIFNNFTTNTKYTFSLNLNHGYCNNVELSQDSEDYWGSGTLNKMYIFNVHSGGMRNNPLLGKLYAIRIYDRRLTSEEQLHNQNIDAKRFNITI